MKTYCFGIDVGGTSVKCGLFHTDGTLVEKWEIPTRTENNGQNILPDVAETINAKLAEKNIDKADVEGVGIGIPGPINSRGEAACAVNLYWGFTPVAQILGDLTGLKAQAGNDANVAALGEAWKGAAAGAQNIIMITLGTGVGGGIIINGKILAGSHGDGEHKPEGLCEYAWKPIKEMVKMLSEGELLQPRGTWMVDDDKGVFSCVDGLRPVIMLIEAIHADENE